MARIFGDRYELGAVLGRGGMATVYRATDTVLERPVAIKVLADRYAGDERFVERFRREAQASARLNHPNIVSVFDTGDQDGAHYIVMELVEGDTLADLVRREGPLSIERSARIAADVAAALEAAHAEGIVHRDVKPGNVMLTADGTVKVMDFGIARAAEEDKLTQTGVVMGTASYLSPEQSRGDPVDARSDVYSLGCVLYEMLTGEPPFTGESPVAIAYKHVNEPPPPPSSRAGAIPDDVDGVVMRALEKDPSRRFPTAAAFHAALANAGAGVPTEPISAGDTAVLPVGEATTPIDGRPSERGPARWWPGVIAGAAAFVLAAILTLVVMGNGRGGGPPAGERDAIDERIPTVAEALTLLAATVQESVEAQAVTEELGLKLLEEARKIQEEYAKDNLVEALAHGAQAHDAVDRGLVEGDVVDTETARTLHEAIDLVGTALEAHSLAPPEQQPPPEEESPPPEDGGEGEDDDDDSGPGKSEEAPGHNKDDGKGKGKDKE